MKRLLCLMLAVLFLGGCSSKADEGGIFFVYPKKDYIYSVSEGSVAREKRDVTDRELGYLLRLYLLGPQDEELEAIYPSGVRLENLEQTGDTLSIQLSALSNQLSDISFSFAGACLAQTCFSLCEADIVIISSGDRQITVKRGALLFQDDSSPLETSATETESN